MAVNPTIMLTMLSRLLDRDVVMQFNCGKLCLPRTSFVSRLYGCGSGRKNVCAITESCGVVGRADGSEAVCIMRVYCIPCAL